MIAAAAVGVDDDLAAGDAAVGHGAAHHKPAGGVHQELGVHQKLRRNGLLNDFLDDGFFQIFILDVGIMLGRNHDGMHTHGHAVFIAYRHLGLAIGTEKRQGAVFPDFGQPLRQPVGVPDGHGHQVFGGGGGIAEHQTLVAGPLFRGQPPALNPHGDVR